MTDGQFYSMCYFAYMQMKDQAPFDTGNLYNSIKFTMYKSGKTAKIYVSAQAPYMPYTNEPWVSSYWKGKKNPNLYWWDNAITGVFMYLARTFGGDIERVSTPKPMDLVKKANDWQNQTGDLMPEDLLLHSSYIENAQDPFADFYSRAQMIGR